MNTQKSNQQQTKGNGRPGKAIVLVHGGFVDGSGWAGVYRTLKNQGYNVLVVQNPTKSLADDVATTKAAIDSVDGDVVLVGHSYGGVVITEGFEPRLHYGVRPRYGRIRVLFDCESSAGRTGSADFAPQRRLSLPRPRKIRRFLCCGC